MKVFKKLLLLFLFLQTFDVIMSSNVYDHMLRARSLRARKLGTITLNTKYKQSYYLTIHFIFTYKGFTLNSDLVKVVLKSGTKTIEMENAQVTGNTIEASKKTNSIDAASYLINGKNTVYTIDSIVDGSTKHELTDKQTITLVNNVTDDHFILTGVNFTDPNDAYSYTKIFIYNSYDKAYNFEVVGLNGEFHSDGADNFNGVMSIAAKKNLTLTFCTDTILIIFSDTQGNIVSVTPNFKVKQVKDYYYEVFRRVYLQKNDTTQTIRVKITSEDQTRFNVLEKVSFRNGNSKIYLDLNKTASTTNTKVYEKKMKITEEYYGNYYLVLNLLGVEYTTTEIIYIRAVIDEIVDVTDIKNIPDCNYYQKEFKFVFNKKIAEANFKIYASEGGWKSEFVQSSSNLNIYSLPKFTDGIKKLGGGEVKIELFDGDETDISLYYVLRHFTDLELSTENKLIKVFSSIKYVELSCDASGFNIQLKKREGGQQANITSLTYKATEHTLTGGLTYSVGGIYDMYVDNINFGSITLYTKSGAGLVATLPLDVQKGKINVIKLTGGSAYWNKVEKIYMKVSNEEIEKAYYKTSVTVAQQGTFKVTTGGIEVNVKVISNYYFYLTVVVFEGYSIQEFGESVILAHLFDAKPSQYLITTGEIQANMTFNTKVERDDDVNVMFYKYGSTVSKFSTCTKYDVQNGTTWTYSLECKFSVPTSFSGDIYFGKTEKLISCQTISLVKPTYGTTQRCFTTGATNIFNIYLQSSGKFGSKGFIYNAETNEAYKAYDKEIDGSTIYKQYAFNITELPVGKYYFSFLLDATNSTKFVKAVDSDIEIIERVEVMPDQTLDTYFGNPEKLKIEFVNRITSDTVKGIILRPVYYESWSYVCGTCYYSYYENVTEFKFGNKFDITIMNTMTSPSAFFKESIPDISQLKAEQPNGKYRIFYINSCGAVIDTALTMHIRYNQIKTISTIWSYTGYTEKQEVGITYKSSEFFSKRKPIKIRLINYKTKNTYDFDFGANYSSFIIPAGSSLPIGKYTIYTIYSSINNGYSYYYSLYYTEEETIFYMIKQKIELQNDYLITSVQASFTDFDIDLKGEYFDAQIVSVYTNFGDNKTYEEITKITDKYLAKTEESVYKYHVGKGLVVKTDQREYNIKIIDITGTEVIYTIRSVSLNAIQNATFTIVISNPAVRGSNNTNEISIISNKSYPVSYIQYIKLIKYNTLIESQEEIYYCRPKYTKGPCSKGVYGRFTEVSNEETIKLYINYTNSDKYKYRYIVKEIHPDSEAYFKEYTFTEHVLADYMFEDTSTIVDIPSGGISAVAARINFFSATAVAGLNVNCFFTHPDLLGNECKVISIYNESTYAGFEFTFTTINIAADIAIRFTNDDENNHYIHLVKSGYETPCQPKGEYLHNYFILYHEHQIYGYRLHKWDDETTQYELEPEYNETAKETRFRLDEDDLQAMTQNLVINIYKEQFVLLTNELIFDDVILKKVEGELTDQLVATQPLIFYFKNSGKTTLDIELRNGDLKLTSNNCNVDSINQNQVVCNYNLQYNTNLYAGIYDVYYQSSTCGEYRNSGVQTRIIRPPVTLNSLTPTLKKYDLAQNFFLTYLYRFYSDNAATQIKLMYDAFTPDDDVTDTVLKIEDHEVNAAQLQFIIGAKAIKAYKYSVKLYYQDNTEAYYSDKTILIYEYDLELAETMIKRLETEFWYSVNIKLKYSILEDQITKMAYKEDTANTWIQFHDSEYKLTNEGTVISILKDREFGKETIYQVKITDFLNNDVMFKITVLPDKTLKESDLTVTVPRPGIELEYNTLTFTATNYRVEKITKIIFKRYSNDRNVTFDLSSCSYEIDFEANTISLDIYLEEYERYILVAIEDETRAEKVFSGEYVLMGYHIKQDLYFITKEIQSINIQIDFYDEEVADIMQLKIYINHNTTTYCTRNETLVTCIYYFANWEPQNIIIGISENDVHAKTIRMITAEVENVCQVVKDEQENVLLKVKAVDNAKTLLAYLNAEEDFYEATVIANENYFTYIYEFAFDKDTSYNFFIQATTGYTEKIEMITQDVKLIQTTHILSTITEYKLLNTGVYTETYLDIDNLDIPNEDISKVILVKTDNSAQIETTNFTVTTMTFGGGRKLQVNYKFDENTQEGQYYVKLVDACGGVSVSDEHFKLTLVDAPNAIESLDKTYVKVSQVATTSFTASYFVTLSTGKSPSTISLVKYDSTESYKCTYNTFDNTGKQVVFKCGSVPVGLYRIKTVYDDQRTETSLITILVYQNEIEFTSGTVKQYINTEVSTITITLTSTIFANQIRYISYVPQNQQDVPVFCTFTVTGTKIVIKLPTPIKMIDNYIFTIYDRKDIYTKHEFTLQIDGVYNGELTRSILFIKDSQTSVDIPIKFESTNLAELFKDSVYIVHDSAKNSNSQVKLTCTKTINILTCKYSLSSTSPSNLTLLIGENDDRNKKSMYLVKYTLNENKIEPVTANKNNKLLTTVSTVPLYFFFDTKSIGYSSSTSNGISTSVVYYSDLINAGIYEGKYAIVVEAMGAKSTLNDKYFIYVTSKKATFTAIYASYIGVQKVTFTFSSELIDEEVQKVVVGTVASSKCERVDGARNKLYCYFDLSSLTAGKKYDIKYVNILSETIYIKSSYQIDFKLQATSIINSVIDSSVVNQVVIKFSKKFATNDVLKIQLVDSDGHFVYTSIEGLALKENSATFYFESTEDLKQLDGEYRIFPTLNSGTDGVVSNVYMTIYNKEKYEFIFSRTYISKSKTDIEITITPNIKGSALTKVFINKEELVLKGSSYIYTVKAGTTGTLKLTYQTVNGGSEVFEYKKYIYVVEDSTKIFTVSNNKKSCYLYGLSYQVDLTALHSYDLSNLDVYLAVDVLGNQNYKVKFQLTQSGTTYTLETKDAKKMTGETFYLIITDTKDLSNIIYEQGSIRFTELVTADYMYSTSGVIEFSKVFCKPESSDLKFTIGGQDLACNEAGLDTSVGILKCTIPHITNLVYKRHEIISKVTGEVIQYIFLTKKLADSSEFTYERVDDTITVTSSDYYLYLLDKIYFRKESDTTDSNEIIKIEYEYDEDYNSLVFKVPDPNTDYRMIKVIDIEEKEKIDETFLPVVELTYFSLTKRVFFIQSGKLTKVKVTAKLLNSQYSTDNIYFNNEQVRRCADCSDLSGSVTFEYEVDHPTKPKVEYRLKGVVKQVERFEVITYSLDKTCSIIGEDEIKVIFKYVSNNLNIQGTLGGFEPTKTEPNEADSKTYYYKTTFTFAANTFTSTESLSLFAYAKGKSGDHLNAYNVVDVHKDAFPGAVITSSTELKSKSEEIQTVTIKLSSKYYDELPEIKLRNSNYARFGEVIAESKLASDKQTVTLSFDLYSNNGGQHTLYYINSCGDEREIGYVQITKSCSYGAEEKNDTCVIPDRPNGCDELKCKNGGSCILEGPNPKCQCVKGFFGTDCSISNAEKFLSTLTLNYNIKLIFEQSGSISTTVIDEENSEFALSAQQAREVLIQSFNEGMANLKGLFSEQNLANMTIDMLKSAAVAALENTISESTAKLFKEYTFLSITFEVIQKTITTSRRRLEEATSNINQLIESYSQLVKYTVASESAEVDYIKELNLTSFNVPIDDIDGYTKQIAEIPEIMDITEFLKENQGSLSYVVGTYFGAPVMTSAGGDEYAKLLLAVYDNNNNEVTASTNNLKFSYKGTTTTTSENSEKYADLSSQGINIADENDPAFTKVCYTNKKLKADLTVEKRRDIYTSAGVSAGSCVSQGENSYTCSSIENGITLSSQGRNVEDMVSDMQKNYSAVALAFKCLGKTSGLNLGLILSLVVIVGIIAGSLILKFVCSTNLLSYIPNDSEKPNVSFGTQLLFNLANFHPLTCLFSKEGETKMFKLWMLGFTMMSIFGYNAIFFTNSYIDKRFEDATRDSFVYPLSKEAAKLIVALVVSWVTVLIARLLNFILREPQDKKVVDPKGSNLSDQNAKDYSLKMIIPGAFAAVLSVIFMIFATGICGIYAKAQIGWLVSSLWCMLFNMILSVIYLIIITGLEKAMSDKYKTFFIMKKMMVF